MKNRWNAHDAAAYCADPLGLRVYSSRLLGADPELVLHGGGNTSLKMHSTNLFGETEEVLYVKASGWDLRTIEAAGFAPLRLRALLQLAALPQLDDTTLVKAQRAALLDPYAPNPSVEALLHALIPHAYVDHTHADAVLTLSHAPQGEDILRELYGEQVLIVPYVMPGFALARTIYRLSRECDWQHLKGMILLHHGVFSFGDDAHSSYARMIALVAQAEDMLNTRQALCALPSVNVAPPQDLLSLAHLRHSVAAAQGKAVIARWEQGAEALAFTHQDNLSAVSQCGPLTPDHVIRTKPWPLLLEGAPDDAVAAYTQKYLTYFHTHNDGSQVAIAPAPCWALWPQQGLVAFAPQLKETQIILDLAVHTLKAIHAAMRLGGWNALAEHDIFAMEYWELEQAKLRQNNKALPLQGKIALVTGGAHGIGKACVTALRAQGAVVAALDRQWEHEGEKDGVLYLCADVTHSAEVKAAVEATVRQFGGLDCVISNAGTFPPSATIADMPQSLWDNSMAVNLNAHQYVLQASVPYLKMGIDPAVVMIASKNVAAPGPGAAAYSVAKAGQTQLARIAALELAPFGVRVNVLHPNAVFDTAIWTDEILAQRAQHYGMSVADYKASNLLHTEVTSHDVAALACVLVSPLFSKTTGAQIPVDGGNERVI
jgi:rhamnose utilization protein RhaD (predicted bifunctional aldolase and dehydrogenase)/NAD(P)-dependent dehydrogenase (short-subunit alcohol dehydrogenase family)